MSNTGKLEVCTALAYLSHTTNKIFVNKSSMDEEDVLFVVVEIYQAEGHERLPGKAKLPGTCLFVDDKNHRERGREEEREREPIWHARDGWIGRCFVLQSTLDTLEPVANLGPKNLLEKCHDYAMVPGIHCISLAVTHCIPNSPKQG